MQRRAVIKRQFPHGKRIKPMNKHELQGGARYVGSKVEKTIGDLLEAETGKSMALSIRSQVGCSMLTAAPSQ